MILYAVDWCNMFEHGSIDNHPLPYNPLEAYIFSIDKVQCKRYDASNVGRGACYYIWFTMASGWESVDKTYSSCIIVSEKDMTMVMREVKIISVVGCGG